MKNQSDHSEIIFKKKNVIMMFIGLLFIMLGFILMAGGGSDNPEVFNSEMYSFTRIRLAPTLVLIGFGVEFYAILLDSDKKKS